MGDIDKKDDIAITSKKADIQIGAIEDELDGGAIFLRQNGVKDEHIQELLDDKDRNKKLVRKVDLILMPLLAGTYTLQYIDKSALAYSAVFDLFSTAHLSSAQYSWLASILLGCHGPLFVHTIDGTLSDCTCNDIVISLTLSPSTHGVSLPRRRGWQRSYLATSSHGEPFS